MFLVDEPRRAYSGAGDRESYRRAAGQAGGDRGPDKKADAGAGTATFEFVSGVFHIYALRKCSFHFSSSIGWCVSMIRVVSSLN